VDGLITIAGGEDEGWMVVGKTDC
jgi:hypothetical protein